MRVVGKTSTIRWRKFYLAAARFGRRFQTKPKWWPSAKTGDGAKGQQPTQGRAGAGLASPAGIGAGRVCERQVRRTGIFVAAPINNGQSSVRSDIVGNADGRCRPDGAGIRFGLGFYNDAAPNGAGGRRENSPAIYGWGIVQPIQPSPGRDERKPGIGERFCRPWTGLWTLPKREPSHKWLGYCQTHFNATRVRQWWLTARSGRTQGPGQKANGHRKAGPGPS